MRHLLSALADWQVWLHILVYMSIIGPRACLCLYSKFHKFIHLVISSLRDLAVPSVCSSGLFSLERHLKFDSCIGRSSVILDSPLQSANS